MSDFAKRHYEAIAEAIQWAIKDCDSSEQVAGVYRAAHQLADMFKSDNGRFDRERFLHACQPGSNVRARTAHLKTSPLVSIVQENEREELNALSRNGY